jgi:hypothetical protein
MNTFSNTAVATALMIAASTAGWAQISLRPGQYEVTAEMNLAGTVVNPGKDLACITAADVADATRILVREEYAEGCKVSDVVKSGGKWTFTATCEEEGERYTATCEVEFGTDSYTGSMRMEDEKGRTTTIKMSGKRVGDCSPSQAEDEQ